MEKYRIVEREYQDGGKRYILEKFNSIVDSWMSVYSHADLMEIKAAKAEREAKENYKDKVIG